MGDFSYFLQYHKMNQTRITNAPQIENTRTARQAVHNRFRTLYVAATGPPGSRYLSSRTPKWTITTRSRASRPLQPHTQPTNFNETRGVFEQHNMDLDVSRDSSAPSLLNVSDLSDELGDIQNFV